MLQNANVRSTFFLWVFFLIIGIVCLAAGLKNYFDEEAFFAAAEHDTATITRYVPDPDSKAADFCPEYEFTTKAGQKITYVGDNCPSKPDYSKIGQTEEAYIDPQNPQIVESRGWTGSEGSGLLMGIAGFVFFPVVGLFSFVVTVISERRGGTRNGWTRSRRL